ncbi:OsmC-like protein [Trametes cingulata]|nr:OsmC-like protein [Trametes cingulata]
MSAVLLRALARHAPSRAAQRTLVAVPTRSLMTIKDHKYSAHATARGQGRNGQVKSDDDCGLELRLAMPKSLGGKGDGQNPEQLFAMGYAACFLSALQLVAGQTGKTDMARNAVVHTQVHLGEPEGMEGFGLQVDIQVEGVDDMDLIQAGHKACPYSRALAHGAVVNVTKK